MGRVALPITTICVDAVHPSLHRPTMTALLRTLLLLLVLLAGPARADDIAAASRGVVRVVTIAVVDGQVVGFGHGSGFAIGPDRIVTNAHVVELAARYPDDVVIGVVPSEGRWVYRYSVTGELNGVAVMQNFYLVAAPGGEQVVLAFTLSPKNAEKLGARDLSIAASLEVPAGK